MVTLFGSNDTNSGKRCRLLGGRLAEQAIQWKSHSESYYYPFVTLVDPQTANFKFENAKIQVQKCKSYIS